MSAVGTIANFLKELERRPVGVDKIRFFRGHSSMSYKLIPSIYRGNYIHNEYDMYHEAIIKCSEEFDQCNSTFESLVKMQHFTIPTRLLDITTNPLVALFFACSNNTLSKGNSAVYFFDIPKKDIHYYDSDSVSVISNIAKLSDDLDLTGGDSESNSDFNKRSEIQRLVHEIREEKPYFQNLVDYNTFNQVVCVSPKLNNPRIIRQQGAFFLFGFDTLKTSPSTIPSHLYNLIEITKGYRNNICKQLEILGISKDILFPDIDHVAEGLRSKYL